MHVRHLCTVRDGQQRGADGQSFKPPVFPVYERLPSLALKEGLWRRQCARHLVIVQAAKPISPSGRQVPVSSGDSGEGALPS
nr:hypothetical protein [Candidatus Hamiltonella defensa]